jgi:hypothetical protein
VICGSAEVTAKAITGIQDHIYSGTLEIASASNAVDCFDTHAMGKATSIAVWLTYEGCDFVIHTSLFAPEVPLELSLQQTLSLLQACSNKQSSTKGVVVTNYLQSGFQLPWHSFTESMTRQ